MIVVNVFDDDIFPVGQKFSRNLRRQVVTPKVDRHRRGDRRFGKLEKFFRILGFYFSLKNPDAYWIRTFLEILGGSQPKWIVRSIMLHDHADAKHAKIREFQGF